MVRNKSGFFAVSTLLTVAAAALFTACGCQDSKTRKAGKDVRQAIDDARRLYDTAQAMLSSPVYIDVAKNEILPGDPSVERKADPLSRGAGESDKQAKKEIKEKWDLIIKTQTMAPDADETGAKGSSEVLTLKDILGRHYKNWQDIVAKSENVDPKEILEGRVALTVIDKLNTIGVIKTGDYDKLKQEISSLAMPSVLPTTLPSPREAPKVIEAQSDDDQKNVVEPFLRSPANPASIEILDPGVAGASMPAGGAASSHSLSLSPMDPSLVVNPKVPAKLKEAEAILTKSISENKDAPKSDLVLAYSMLARVRCLAGYYQYLTSKPYCQAIDGAARRGEWVIWLIKVDANKRPYLDELLKMQDDKTELNAKLLKGEEDAKKIHAEITSNSDEQKMVAGDIEKLKARISALTAEIMDLKARSAIQKGQESIRTYDLTEPKNQEIKDSYLKIGQMEIQLDGLKVKGKELQAKLKEADAKVAAGKEIVEKRADAKGKIAAQQKGVDDRLAVWQDLMKQITSEMFELAGQARTSFEEAKKAYDQAKGDITQADIACSQGEKSGIQAQLGDLRMALGEQTVRNYQILGRIKDFSALAKSTYEAAKLAPPESLAKLDDCCKGMDDLKKAAVDNFSAAVNNFESAAKKLDKSLENLDKDAAKGLDARDLRWAYEGRMANAYTMLIMLDPSNREHVDNAKKMLGDALAGKEGSPILSDLRRLQEMIK